MSFSSSDLGIQANQVPISVEIPSDPEQFQSMMALYLRRIANALNTKQGGLFTLTEGYSFNQYNTSFDPLSGFPVFKNVYRTTYDMVALNGGSIPASGTPLSFPLNFPLPPNITLLNGTHIYGSATNSDSPPKRLPLPYASNTANKNIEIYFDTTNVTIIVGSAQTALTYCTIVLEYTKQ